MKRNCCFCLFVYLLFALSVVAQNEGDANVNNAEKSIIIEIEHAFNDNKFTPRGKIVAKSLKFDSKQAPLLTQQQLTNENLAQIKAGSQDSGLYKIRARINSGEWVMSSTQLLSLTCSNFRDEIKLHISNNGEAIGISYLSRSPDKNCLSSKQTTPSTHLVHTHSSFDTTFQISAAGEDPRPFFEPTQTSLNGQLNGQNTGTSSPEQKPEEKSFWQKYWYLILPGALLMISNLLSGTAPEDEQRGRQQGAAAPRKR